MRDWRNWREAMLQLSRADEDLGRRPLARARRRARFGGLTVWYRGDPFEPIRARAMPRRVRHATPLSRFTRPTDA